MTINDCSSRTCRALLYKTFTRAHSTFSMSSKPSKNLSRCSDMDGGAQPVELCCSQAQERYNQLWPILCSGIVVHVYTHVITPPVTAALQMTLESFCTLISRLSFYATKVGYCHTSFALFPPFVTLRSMSAQCKVSVTNNRTRAECSRRT